MSDLISRQALKDAMYHEAFETDTEMQRWDSGCWIRYKLFEKIIDNLPSAEPQWVPCEERLPEEGKEVLVTVWDDVKIAHFNIRWADGEQEWCFEEFDLNGEDFDDVKAWCELPKPYERRQ